MLYPDFKELAAYKDRKIKLKPKIAKRVISNTIGNHQSPFRGRGLEFDSVREYVAGDDIRNIDWRVTARTGSPHLKLFKEDRERQVIICIDMNASMRFGTRNTFKSVQAAHVAASLGWQSLSQNDRVGACLFGDVPKGIHFLPPKRTRASLFAFLKTLSEPIQESYLVPLHKAIHELHQYSTSGSLFYVISDFMNLAPDFADESALKRLKRAGDVILISINDPSDQTIPAIGLVGFKNGNTSFCVNSDEFSGREAYHAQWKENRKQLYSLTNRLRIPLIELSTTSNVHPDLTIELMKITRRKTR